SPPRSLPFPTSHRPASDSPSRRGRARCRQGAREMVLYLVQIDVPTQQAEAFSRYQAGHVAKSLAAMGRSAVGMRARVLRDGDVTRFYWFFELPSLSALEAFLTSREREELAAELAEEFPEARVHLSFGELVGGVRRGLRYGEEPGAAFVLDISLPRGEA